MKQVLAVIAAAVALGATPAGAQNDAPPDPFEGTGFEDIGPEDWRVMVIGRTVTYLIGGELWAQEAYDRRSNAVAIRLVDGTCMEGTWHWQDSAYCYAWTGGEYSCFRHVRAGDEILIIPVEDGVPSGTVQTVGGISDVPVACGPELIG